jgi:peptide/nickel transport system permease protein
MLMLLFFIVIALLSPLLVPYNPMSIGQFPRNLPASLEHYFGTDDLGRDIFDQLVAGTRNSLSIGFLAGFTGTFLGVSFGILSGFKGKTTDNILRSIADTLLVIPTWPLLILISYYVRIFDIYTLAGILAVFSWPGAMRSIRAQVMSLREEEYINLARITDLSDIEISYLEILPNLLPYIGVIFGYSVTGAMVAEVGLGLIGIGPRNVATIGLVLNNAWTGAALAKGLYWWIFSPILCIIVIFVSIQLMNLGLDEIYNPRLKRITGA